MTNILMISFDDLNDWSSALGGYAGVVHTPNFDRLAASSAVFANAFSASPVCNPSRSATLTGMSPVSTGVFSNEQLLFDLVDPERTLPALLRDAGYTTATVGKVFHELPDAIGRQLYDAELRSDGLTSSGDKDASQIDYTMTTLEAGIFTGDPAELNDSRTAAAVESYLVGYTPDADAAGLFLSVGISRPHNPWVAPPEFFALYPLEEIVLPDLSFDDLDDLPAFAEFFASRELLDKVVAAGELALFIQAYLASISYADAMLGRVLDALEASAIGGDTVIALWSDHGYHLGDKSSIGKFTLWDEAARSTLILHDPNAPATAGERLTEVVGLTDLYSTLLDYAGIPLPAWAEGESLRTLVEAGADPTLRGYAVTSILGSHSVRTEIWRFTRYEDGSEELYNVVDDPDLRFNLAGDATTAPVRATLEAVLADYLDTLPMLQNLDETQPARLTAAAGEVVLIAGTATDTLAGGAADNVYVIRSAGVVIEEAAGGGVDLVITRNSYTLPDFVENLSFLTKTQLEGTPVLVGNGLANRIAVLSGEGIARGGGGRDTLLGESGNDRLSGEQANDSIESGAGNDTLDGGAGNDTLRGVKGDDVYLLSAGSDVIGESVGNGFDVLDTTDWGGIGNVRVELLTQPNGKAVQLVLSQIVGTARATIDAVSGLINVEALREGATTQLLTALAYAGGVLAETVLGSAGDDTLSGFGEADRLEGGAGDDDLLGFEGDDTLAGGAGDDVLDGGAGVDMASFASGLAGVVVRLDLGPLAVQATGEGGDALRAIENLAGSAFGDSLTGNADANLLLGGGGGDTLVGGGGDDTVIGNAGSDVLTGGAGADRFAFHAVSDSGIETMPVDRITDFERRGDRIDFSAIDADPATAARDAFVFVGAAGFTAAGQARTYLDGAATFVELSINEDAFAELVIQIDGRYTLTAGQFLL